MPHPTLTNLIPRLMLVALLGGSAQIRAAEPSSVEARNKALVERYAVELWEKGDLSVVDRYWAPNVKTEVTVWKGDDIETVKNDVRNYLKAFSEVKTVTTNLVAEGEWVVRRWKTSGRHTGTYSGIPPTNKIIVMQGTEFMRIRDGKIIEDLSDWDAYDAYVQLGVIKPFQP